MKVDPWMNEEIKRFDPELRIKFDPKISRFVVLRRLRDGSDSVAFLFQDRDGGFLRPHPNLAIYGDSSLGLSGLLKRDIWRHPTGVRNYWKDYEDREAEAQRKSDKEVSDQIKANANDVLHSSLVNPRVSVPDGPFWGKKKAEVSSV